MPFFLSSFFHHSDHPMSCAALFPLPSEWEFFESEEINIIKCVDVVAEEGHVEKNAIVRTIEAWQLEVKLTNGEGLICISWAVILFPLQNCWLNSHLSKYKKLCMSCQIFHRS